MRISYVLALALASNLAFGAEETATLNPIVISSTIQKSALEEPVNSQLVGKGAILENSDIAKSISNLSGFSMERKGGAVVRFITARRPRLDCQCLSTAVR